MPRFNDFLVHFFAVHRAQGYNVYYPCPVCDIVYDKFGTLGTHVQSAQQNTWGWHIASRSACSSARAYSLGESSMANHQGYELANVLPKVEVLDTGELIFPSLSTSSREAGVIS